MHIAMITAGGAGMYCGSCMHDNTWAHALMNAGAEVSLIPTYTPVRVDEADASLDRIFLGGINVYLNARFRWWSRLPRFTTRWLDHPRVIRMATRKSVSNDAHELGSLTVSMLEGEQGPHQTAINELTHFVVHQLRPDVVLFSNALLSGAVTQLRSQFSGPVICVLQGDDVFLDGLLPEYRETVMSLLQERTTAFSGYLTHSDFYREYMREYLSLGSVRIDTIPLGIQVQGHDGQPAQTDGNEYRVGYFARIAPEKGLHYLAEAFPLLKQDVPNARLKIGGYLGEQHRSYFDGIMNQLKPWDDSIEYIGSPDTHQGKVEFMKSIDVLSVPTEFLEPKGLYVLEAMANGGPCRAATSWCLS